MAAQFDPSQKYPCRRRRLFEPICSIDAFDTDLDLDQFEGVDGGQRTAPYLFQAMMTTLVGSAP